MLIFIKQSCKSCPVVAIHNPNTNAMNVVLPFSPKKDLRSIFRGSMVFTVKHAQLTWQYRNSQISLGKKNNALKLDCIAFLILKKSNIK